MSEFDLDNDRFNDGSERVNRGRRRMVRRHDVPDPSSPANPFDIAEQREVEMDIDRSQTHNGYGDDADLPYYTENGPAKGRRTKTSGRRADTDARADDTDAGQPARHRVRKTTDDGDNRQGGGPMAFLFDRRFHIFLGIACIIIASVMCVVLVSHLHAAAQDQSVVLAHATVDNMAQTGRDAANAGGWFGAWLSHALFTDALGVGSFVLVIYLFAIGGCLLAQWRINFWSFTFKSLLLAITVSIVTGLVTYAADSEVFWGGTHGHYVNHYLFGISDWIGPLTVSVLLIVAVCCAFYYPIKKGCKTCARYMPSFSRHHYDDNYDDADYRNNQTAVTAAADVQSARPDVLQSLDDEPTENNEHPVVSTTVDEPANDGNADAASSGDDILFTIDDNTPSTVNSTASPAARTGNTADSQTVEMDVERPEIESGDGAAAGEGFVVDSDEQPDYDPHAELPHYRMPPIDLLEERPATGTVSKEELERYKQRIVKTLGDYGIGITSVKAIVGPTITLYEIVPSDGTRIRNIKNLEDDIALSLAAKGIRIIAPMPGKGTVGIEVPNDVPQTVSMRSVIESRRFESYDKPLPIALGATISNDVFCLDVSSMPHALVAGATGMGKSVGLNDIIASLLYKKHPADLKFVLIDPKMVEFSLYAKLEKHYLAKLPDEDEAIITDSTKVLPVLQSLCVEMDQRYALLKDAGVREIKEYNSRFIKRRLNPDKGHRYLPYIVVVIDEFADLIMMGRKEIETPVTRITQKARAVGIHMIIATQRPSTNVLTGLIKANCPSRIAFRVNQMVDSRTILDSPGANKLIGRGDMLYSAGGAMERVQCAFISTDEVERICDFVNSQPGFLEPYVLPDPLLAAAAEAGATGGGGGMAGGGLDRDALFNDCARFIITQANASTSILQRRFEIGYNRAGKIMDQMEACGIVGPASGNKPRAVLVDSATLEHILNQGHG